MPKVRWDKSGAHCPRCGGAMEPADLVRGLSYLDERVHICRTCGPVLDSPDGEKEKVSED
jgi:hypothetical protein